MSEGRGCDNARFYPADKFERIILPRIVDIVIDDEPTADPIITLEQQITSARSKATEIEKQFQRSMQKPRELAERAQAKLENEVEPAP